MSRSSFSHRVRESSRRTGKTARLALLASFSRPRLSIKVVSLTLIWGKMEENRNKHQTNVIFIYRLSRATSTESTDRADEIDLSIQDKTLSHTYQGCQMIFTKKAWKCTQSIVDCVARKNASSKLDCSSPSWNQCAPLMESGPAKLSCQICLTNRHLTVLTPCKAMCSMSTNVHMICCAICILLIRKPICWGFFLGCWVWSNKNVIFYTTSHINNIVNIQYFIFLHAFGMCI